MFLYTPILAELGLVTLHLMMKLVNLVDTQPQRYISNSIFLLLDIHQCVCKKLKSGANYLFSTTETDGNFSLGFYIITLAIESYSRKIKVLAWWWWLMAARGSSNSTRQSQLDGHIRSHSLIRSKNSQLQRSRFISNKLVWYELVWTFMIPKVWFLK